LCRSIKRNGRGTVQHNAGEPPQGKLTKDQILESWGIADADYRELQKAVLAADKSIEKGPKHSGGFEVKKRKGKFPEDGAADTLLLRNEWEKGTVARLAELLQHGHLEDLLGTLLQTVRQV
jgi:hypothetical protein